ncbi:hypothetical protein [Cloacibacillus porcorum]|uniref:hypothetical protein n=1 Tax=Cloacibacillus porcorum TaxID=1197717 RepID=UPI00258613B3|nr:hypothetical protein [Cloacibacillus porcorum]
MAASLDMQAIALKVGQRLRALAVKETVPVGKGSRSWRKVTKRGKSISGGVDKQGGELRRSVTCTRFAGGAIVGTNKIYARAVHEGLRAIVIRPKKKRALAWAGGEAIARRVFQKAREGNPFFRKAVDLFSDDFDNEVKSLGIEEGAAEELKRALENKGIQVKKG